MRVQPADHAPDSQAAGHGAETGHGEGEASGGLLATIAKIVNSGILVATLIYFLRPPIAQYLADRAAQIRQDLVEAAVTRDRASAELQKLERRLAGLPAELEALRARGAQEMATEEARLRQTTEGLRERLLAQARREIDLEAKAAERHLRERAAELTVDLAAERIQRGMTERDQLRLVDRYVEHIPA